MKNLIRLKASHRAQQINNINNIVDLNVRKKITKVKHHYNCQCTACFYPLADSQEILDNALTAPTEYNNTFKLHSNPNANHTIYLDFDGYSISSSVWEEGNSLSLGAYDTDGDATTFSAEELADIQKMWQRAAEDFAPFNVNVTTEEPADLGDLTKNGSGDIRWGIRVAITDNRNLDTGNKIKKAGGGGTAYYNSFNWSKDEVALVFNKGAYAGGETISHEVGHSLNLRHDGQGSTVYYAGHGNGETSWAPIMGAAFQGNNDNVTQWSRGSLYYNGNEDQDDLSIITTYNGFDYLVDDYSSPQLLELNTEGTFGVIEQNNDIDIFEFSINTGIITIDVNPASRVFINNGTDFSVEYLDTYGPNLNIWAGIYNSDNSLLIESSPSDSLSANFNNLFLETGTYYLHIDGIGLGDPLANNPTGFDDYGSLGQYTIDNIFEEQTSIVSIIGTQEQDTLVGTINSEEIIGLAGNDSLDGNGGSDTLIGGPGNDIYVLDSLADILIENVDEGRDKVKSKITYTLEPNFENLTLTGKDNIDAFGNNSRNNLIGNLGDNFIAGYNDKDRLNGKKGNDTLDGGLGVDNFTGGQGDDILYLGLNDNARDIVRYSAGHGTDTIYDFDNDLFSIKGIDFIDVLSVGSDTEFRIANIEFGTGKLISTIIGVNNFTENELGIEGTNIHKSNVAEFIFS